MSLQDVSSTVKDLQARLTALRSIFDVPGKQARVSELASLSAQPGFWDDQEKARAFERERSNLEKQLKDIAREDKALEDAEVLIELGMEAGDDSVEDEARALVDGVSASLAKFELRRMMSGEHDQNSAIIEIHAGAGGTDAQDWAEMLLRMYTRWCERSGFDVEEADRQLGEEAGIKGATIFVRGEYAFGWLRAEEGVHRLVRISPFDANKRRQTAFAAVRVTPELDDDVNVDVDWEKDVREDRYHASGAGGQHVNKTESAIRLTHLETGIVVQCQSERSQHKNRATARKILASRLFDYYQAQQDEERSKISGEKLKIEWGSQIRSYVNHPYQMVKDHRTDQESSQFAHVLDGDLDAFMEAYLLSTAEKAKH
ncbi:MAG: peptide chain release factor 2 [Deltaproteobacteria bacterium]